MKRLATNLKGGGRLWPEGTPLADLPEELRRHVLKDLPGTCWQEVAEPAPPAEETGEHEELEAEAALEDLEIARWTGTVAEMRKLLPSVEVPETVASWLEAEKAAADGRSTLIELLNGRLDDLTSPG